MTSGHSRTALTNDAVEVARELIADLTRDSRTLAVAESLTGGLLASTIVSVPGASMCFRGGVVTYMTDTKASVLGVSQEQLDETGPVDPTVAEQMARGVAELFNADIGLSTTGVAGPGPADGHEAGTVVVGLYTSRGASSAVFHFDGQRQDVRSKSVLGALCWVSENLTDTRHL